jgi:hypothetical protein
MPQYSTWWHPAKPFLYSWISCLYPRYDLIAAFGSLGKAADIPPLGTWLLSVFGVKLATADVNLAVRWSIFDPSLTRRRCSDIELSAGQPSPG